VPFHAIPVHHQGSEADSTVKGYISRRLSFPGWTEKTRPELANQPELPYAAAGSACGYNEVDGTRRPDTNHHATRILVLRRRDGCRDRFGLRADPAGTT